MINILHIVPALDGGGIENTLLSYYTNMNRSRFKFDFIVYGDKVGALEADFEKMGATIYHIPSRHENLWQSLKKMKEIICSNKYDIVHAHQNRMSFISLFYAKKCGIRVRIAHSHTAYEQENIVKHFERRVCSILIRYFSTNWFACGVEAGKWLYGEKAVKSEKFHIMNNAIDIDQFIFNNDIRKQKREELRSEDKFIIGNVGRLSFEKNHEFILKVFNEIHRINSKAILLLVGRGPLEEKIKEQVEIFGLAEAVKFLGYRSDVPQLLQAMDVFLLPSKWEGLPVVLVEAQASGLKSFAADTITDEVKVSNVLTYKSLEQSYVEWATEILKYANGYERKNISDKICQGGYEIKQEAEKMEKTYEKFMK